LEIEKLRVIHSAYGKSCTLVSTSAFSTVNAHHLTPEEKLAILQASDTRRKWYSLDDERVCVLCGRAITGRQIEITRDARGGYSLHCPTEGCSSVLSDWFYHGSGCSTAKSPAGRSIEVDLW
jgi:hypothetical protein